MKPGGKIKNRWRFALTMAVAALLIFAGVQLFFGIYVDPYIEKQLKQAVANRTEGRYQLLFEDLRSSLWGRKLRLEAPELLPTGSDSAGHSIRGERVVLEGFRYLSYLYFGEINIGALRLVRPDVRYVESGPDLQTILLSKKNISRPVVSIDLFQIIDGTLTIASQAAGTKRGSIEQIELAISGMQVDSASAGDAPYFTFEAVSAVTGAMSYDFRDGLYSLSADHFGLSTREQFCYVDSLSLRPKLPRYEFSRYVGHEVDRIDLAVSRVAIQNFYLEKILKSNFKADKLHIQDAELDVFHNNKMPSAIKSKRRFPHVALQRLNFPVTVDTITVNGSRLRYTEHLPRVSKPWTVTFGDLTATLYGVTNDSGLVHSGRIVEMKAETNLMNAAPFRVQATFPLRENGFHTVRGSLESMEVTALNPVLEPLGLVRAMGGTIHGLDFWMEMGVEQATGQIRLNYSDLNLKFLDRKDLDEGGSQRLVSFLANTFRIRSDNRTIPLRKGTVRYGRIPEKSIFSYWWKALASGLNDSIGL